MSPIESTIINFEYIKIFATLKNIMTFSKFDNEFTISGCTFRKQR